MAGMPTVTVKWKFRCTGDSATAPLLRPLPCAARAGAVPSAAMVGRNMLPSVDTVHADADLQVFWMNAETPLMTAIRIRAGAFGAVLFRNTVGMFYTHQGEPIHCGVGSRGGSDLIGWTREGRFLAIEVKVPGARTDPGRLAAQQNFIDQVRQAGGRAGFASTVEDAARIIYG